MSHLTQSSGKLGVALRHPEQGTHRIANRGRLQQPAQIFEQRRVLPRQRQTPAAGSTDPDKLVTALEKTDYVGTVGRVQFYGRNDQYTHALKYGEGLVTGVDIQWQNGKQMTVWPRDKANAKIEFPSFVKLPKQAANTK